ncbi:unnamed protein product [Amoebophrya sp. A25]|nr:unnamed protein product [Amoebophrya sp. A25]|eukprot:GSA25T00025122001.1
MTTTTSSSALFPNIDWTVFEREPWPSILVASVLLIFIMGPNWFFRLSDEDERRLARIKEDFERGPFMRQLEEEMQTKKTPEKVRSRLSQDHRKRVGIDATSNDN